MKQGKHQYLWQYNEDNNNNNNNTNQTNLENIFCDVFLASIDFE